MALLPATGSVGGTQGETTLRPNFHHTISFDGDAAYVTGGSANFQQFCREVIGDKITVLSVSGSGLNVATTSILHHPVYDKANDKLQMFIAATGVEAANAADLSGTKLTVTVTSK